VIKMESSSIVSVTVTLQPINLYNQGEFDELLRQRVLCGWHDNAEAIEAWRVAVDQKTKSLFWIIPSPSPSPTVESRYAGHIALMSEASPPDEDQARPDKTVMMLSNLFVLKEYRRGGIARAAVEIIEKYARIEPYGSPNCKVITVNTISRRYTEDDGEEWRGSYARRGMEPPPKGSALEDWYARMGYVKWKEAPTYEDTFLDGTPLMLVAAYLRKELE